MKAHELAMHVSLLNQENEQIIQKLQSMENKLALLEDGSGDEKKDSVCD
jgi:hypothetical protein